MKCDVTLAYISEYAHPGPSLSITDILVALYYHQLNINPKNSEDIARDRVVLSKGHGCLSLYAILADLGYYSKDENLKLRKIDSIVQGHPNMKRTPGIDFTSGSLGNGLGAAVGISLSLKIDQINSNIYCILGDGETQEGLVWEAASIASHLKLDNLIAIIDKNNFQSTGSLKDINNMEPLKAKWEAFGWKVLEIDGHNFQEILDSFETASSFKDTPTAIIAETVKGKGISFMENNNMWHQHGLTKEQCEKALSEIGYRREVVG